MKAKTSEDKMTPDKTVLTAEEIGLRCFSERWNKNRDVFLSTKFINLSALERLFHKYNSKGDGWVEEV